MTAATLAKLIDAKPPHISQLESGSRLPSIRTILSLCRALSCPLSALLPDHAPLPAVDEGEAADQAADQAAGSSTGDIAAPRPLAALLSRPARRT